MSESILLAIEDGIGVITLNRPDKLNAWDSPMRDELANALKTLNSDSAARAIIVTGAGELAFSAGQDLAETQSFKSGADGHEWFLSWRGFYDSMRTLEKGCVAALNGVAAGSAFQFSLLADVRVGHPAVRMGQPEINSGIPSVLGPPIRLWLKHAKSQRCWLQSHRSRCA
jgi:enoyl-CoA hydratase